MVTTVIERDQGHDMTLEETFTNIGWLTNERKLQPANISVSSNVLSLAVNFLLNLSSSRSLVFINKEVDREELRFGS